MAKKWYIGVADKARKVKKAYVGVSGIARKVKKGYIGVNGVARPFFASEVRVTLTGSAIEEDPDTGMLDWSATATVAVNGQSYTPMPNEADTILIVSDGDTIECSTSGERLYPRLPTIYLNGVAVDVPVYGANTLDYYSGKYSYVVKSDTAVTIRFERVNIGHKDGVGNRGQIQITETAIQ